MLVELRVRHDELEVIGEPMQPRPFARRHLANALLVDFAFNVRDWCQVGLTLVDYQVSLTSHAAAHDRACDAVDVAYDISEAVSLVQMTLFVSS